MWLQYVKLQDICICHTSMRSYNSSYSLNDRCDPALLAWSTSLSLCCRYRHGRSNCTPVPRRRNWNPRRRDTSATPTRRCACNWICPHSKICLLEVGDEQKQACTPLFRCAIYSSVALEAYVSTRARLSLQPARERDWYRVTASAWSHCFVIIAPTCAERRTPNAVLDKALSGRACSYLYRPGKPRRGEILLNFYIYVFTHVRPPPFEEASIGHKTTRKNENKHSARRQE